MSDTLAAPAMPEQIASAKALARSLGVETGPNDGLAEVIGVPTVYVVSGGTCSQRLTPFVAVVTRDEHAAWVAAADLVGSGGARVDAMPLL